MNQERQSESERAEGLKWCWNPISTERGWVVFSNHLKKKKIHNPSEDQMEQHRTHTRRMAPWQRAIKSIIYKPHHWAVYQQLHLFIYLWLFFWLEHPQVAWGMQFSVNMMSQAWYESMASGPSSTVYISSWHGRTESRRSHNCNRFFPGEKRRDSC